MGSLHGCFRAIFVVKLNETVALVHGNAENFPVLFVHILHGLARHRLRGKISDKDASFQHLGVVAASISSVSLENFEHSLTSHLARLVLTSNVEQCACADHVFFPARAIDISMEWLNKLRLSEKMVNFCVLEFTVNWKDRPESHLEILAPTALSTGS